MGGPFVECSTIPKPIILMNNAVQQPPILRAVKLSKSFLGLQALQEFTAEVKRGEILGLIGPNGAGKTTCFNVLTGFLRPTAGTIEFDGQDITHLPAARVARLGMARTFQNIRLFGTLSVLENVRSAAQLHVHFNLAETMLNGREYRRKESEILNRSLEILALMELDQLADHPAGSLPYGAQRRLEIARALGTTPKMLLLDEPAAGMNPAESDALNELILDIRKRFDLTIILVEHDMRLVMNLCDRIIVLNYGKTIASGSPEVVRSDSQVIAAYLGESSAAVQKPPF
jgi:branched-chain amino acid transport system ATP-binding protein